MFLPIIKPIVRIILRILSIILFALTLLAAYGGRVNPDIMAFPSVLTLALPYFAIATIIVTLLWLLARRFITAALGALTLFAAWAPISTAMPMHFPSQPSDATRTFTLLSYNICHGWDQAYPDPSQQPGNPTFEYIVKSDADLVGVQELADVEDPSEVVNMQTGLLDSLYRKYPYRAGSPNNDQKVFSKYPVRYIELPKDIISRNGYSLYEVSMPWGKLTWINVHLNSYDLSDKERGVMREVVSVKRTEQGLKEMKGSIRQKLFAGFRMRAAYVRELVTLIRRIRGPLIVSGDFNDVAESYIYRMIRSEGLRDAYVDTSFGPMATYNRYGFWFHLDQVLYRPDPLRALSLKKGSIRSSDHYPLLATFEWETEEHK